MPTPANRDPHVNPTGTGSDVRDRTGYRPRLEGDGRAATSPAGSPIPEDGRGLGELVRELRDEATQLVRQEVALAKAEMREKVHVYTSSLTSMAVGGGLLLAALLFVAWAVNMALTALLEGMMGVEAAIWVSPLILAIVFGLVGYSMIKKATSAVREEGIAPHETIETLKEDKRWAERKVKS